MKSLGTKVNDSPIKMSEKMDNEVRYPTLNLNSDQVEGLEDCKIGDKLYFIAECEIDGMDRGKDYGTKDGCRATICIKSAAIKPDIDDEDEEPKTIDEAYDKVAKSMKEKD
jgi:hypothetical protein